jgi:hypothetical protein
LVRVESRSRLQLSAFGFEAILLWIIACRLDTQ